LSAVPLVSNKLVELHNFLHGLRKHQIFYLDIIILPDSANPIPYNGYQGEIRLIIVARTRGTPGAQGRPIADWLKPKLRSILWNLYDGELSVVGT